MTQLIYIEHKLHLRILISVLLFLNDTPGCYNPEHIKSYMAGSDFHLEQSNS